MQNLKKLTLFFSIFVCNEIIAVGTISIVYAIKISEPNKIVYGKAKTGFGFTPFEQARWRRDCLNKSNAVGELLTFIHVERSIFARIDFAFARVSEVTQGVPFARIQTDDLLLTAGYVWRYPQITCSLSGLMGIPTHKDTSLEHIQFGLAHLGLGTQFYIGARYLPQRDYAIRALFRFVGFIPRRVEVESWSYILNTGQAIDVLISHYAPFGAHDFEIGYNPTFLLGIGISPQIPAVSGEKTLIRNNYFATYRYTHVSSKLINSFRVGIGFGSDVIPKLVGQKLIVTGWFVWAIAF